MISPKNTPFKISVGIRNATDFSPFGVELKGRNFEVSGGGNYRFGFNGMEADNDVKGEGNSYTTEYRQYDSRIGRWLTIDKLASGYSSETPYSFARNSPTSYIDVDGQKWVNVHEENITELKSKLISITNERIIRKIEKNILKQQKLANQVNLNINAIKVNDPFLYYYIENLQVSDARTGDCLDVNVRVHQKASNDAPKEGAQAMTTNSKRDSNDKKRYIEYKGLENNQDIVAGPINSKDEIGFDIYLYGASEFNDIDLSNEAGDVMFVLEYPIAEIKSGSDLTKTQKEYTKKGTAGDYSFRVEDLYKERKKSGIGKIMENSPYPIVNEYEKNPK